MPPTTAHHPPSAGLNIEVLSAGAGSGKTYTLTGRMVELLKGGVRPAGIMATTFTQKAAAELQDRVRVRLLEAGMTEAANELGEALIGTVHSIGTRLLQRFAFEAGVSPLVEIIAENDGQRLFNESLSQVLTTQRIEQMNVLADRLGLTKKTQNGTYDWRRVIRELTDVARANNFSKAVLQASKQRSWESFERLLPPVQNTDAVTWNNRLLTAIDQTVAALDANEADSTKVTRDAAEVLRNFQNQLKYRGELYWHEWVKIAKTNPGAKSRDLVEALQTLALSHDEHRQFREDVKGFIDLVFDIATDALDEYEQYKKKRGLIDYTDMETYVSRLLRVDTVRETLARELDLLLVDEFQDTSPIQLDIFLRISRLARHSIWVGDPKQSIYGFRGAEPALMQAIINATGGIKAENILKKSWRSRPDIVYAVNAIFTRAFSDMPPEQVVLEPAFNPDPTPDPSTDGRGDPTRNALGSASPLPSVEGSGVGLSLIHWHFRSELDERKVPGQPWFDNCIADQISVMLQRKVLIYNKKRTKMRPVRPGDIAVLCRSNKGCRDMADALHRAGLKAAISRAGLLETPEAKLALACLKYLLTPSDALSIAEILLLTGAMDLEAIVGSRIAFLDAVRSEQTRYHNWENEGVLRHLAELRPRTADLSASEILNLVLDELDLRRIAVRLGTPSQRLDNLDRLRKYALDYESACQRLHSAASLGGFLLWLNDLAAGEGDEQGSGESDDAVKVLTYHRSKGLEYPVAICHNLNQNLKEQIWGINLVAETDAPDLDDILGNRWLRFWINPYADQLRGTRLEETLLQTPEWAQATRTALDEEARLLYVGLTRARDYLVFPTNAQGTKWLNRVFNQGDENTPTLDPDSEETPFYRDGLPLLCDTEALYKPRDFPESPPDASPVPFHPERSGRHPVPRLSLAIDPIQETPPGFDPKYGEPFAWSSWLEFKGDFTPALLKAVQTFLMADVAGIPQAERMAVAQKQLQIRGAAEALAPEALLRHSDAFRQLVQHRLAPAAALAHYPMEGWYDPGSGPERQGWERQLRLEADLFLENREQVIVLMFAGFAEGMKKWRQQAQALAPAMGWSRVLLRRAFPEKTIRYWAIFPIEAQCVEVLF
ncbi:MAG: UvrD-helicase domain-containing protein [Lewinellaceae bacterium]|nr:UvrD-helicase domain-containing protein [Lewinellaceae bacterium]